MRNLPIRWLVLGLLVFGSAPMLAQAGGVGVRQAGCGQPACVQCAASAPCEVEPQMVEKVVMVPTWGKERRTIHVTEYTTETRERTYTVCRQVPETTQVTRDVTIMVPVTKTRTVTEVVCVPTYHDVQQQYTACVPTWQEVQRQIMVNVPYFEDVQNQVTVMVPHQEVRTGTRTVCRMIPTTETRTVTVDRGHWEDRVVNVPCVRSCAAPRRCFVRRCGGCGTCGSCEVATCAPAVQTVTCRVWVRNCVTEEHPVTVMRPQMSEEPYQYTVTVCRPETRTVTHRVCRYRCEPRTITQRVCHYNYETRTRTVRVCQMQPQERTREVSYTVCEPRTETRVFNETSYRTVTEERTATYTVQVPHVVQREIEVDVCHMEPKTVMVPACETSYAVCTPCVYPIRARRFCCR